MKKIMIETVGNGCIVTDYVAERDIAWKSIAVYNHIGDLQADLPALLGEVVAPEPNNSSSEGENTEL